MKTLVSIFTIAIVALIYGCAMPMNSFNSNSNGWKPDDFTPGKGILLIQRTVPKSQQKKIEDFMTEKYGYKYEFVDEADLTNNVEKFADKKIYRFALVSSYRVHDMHQNDMSRRPLKVGVFDYNFVDRLKNKDYPKSGIGSSWASMTFKKIIETCLKD